MDYVQWIMHNHDIFTASTLVFPSLNMVFNMNFKVTYGTKINPQKTCKKVWCIRTQSENV